VREQRTIKKAVEIEGVGLQTGAHVKVRCKQSPADSGINFIRVDLPNKPLLNIQALDLEALSVKERRTTLGLGPFEVQTVEHLLAALSGLGIDNIAIEVDNAELPGLDGSARDYTRELSGAGFLGQGVPAKECAVDAPVWCADQDATLIALPYDGFKVSYMMSYSNKALGDQYYSAVVTPEIFAKEIAPARTFCLEEEAVELLKRGLGKGANYDNTLVMGKAGPIKNTVRFPNEPVRHKVLDLIGDLYLLGAGLKAHVVAIKSGHRLNMELVKRLKPVVA